METYISKLKNLEKNNFIVKLARFFIIPILNKIPESVLKKFMRKSSNDAVVVMDNVGSAKALEVMYGRYKKNLFSKGLLQGIADLFWHHVIDQTKGVRNRLAIVKDNLDKEIKDIIENNKSREIKIVTIGGGSARGIVEVLDKYSKELIGWNVSVINIDKSPKAIELGKELAKEFNMYEKFTWIEDLAQNVKFLVKENSVDIVEMVGLLDYFRDEKSIEVFQEIYKILKNNGLFMVGNIVPNKEQPFILKMGWPKMYYRFAPDLSGLLIKSGFDEKKGKIIIEPLLNHIIAVIKK